MKRMGLPMAILTTKLRDCLSKIVNGPYPVADIFSDDFFNEFFYFEGVQYDDPDEYEQKRVQSVCQVSDPEEIENIWFRAIADHYEQTYMDDYYQAILEDMESVVVKSFKSLTVFFSEDLEEAGIDPTTVPDFKASLDWESDVLTIEGDLTALEIILNEIMRGVGWAYYDSLEDFIACNGEDQTKRILNHLHYLGDIERVYGTTYDFFLMSDITEFDRYRCFGDGDVTDQELLDAMCA